jgi:hypothetical protein
MKSKEIAKDKNQLKKAPPQKSESAKKRALYEVENEKFLDKLRKNRSSLSKTILETNQEGKKMVRITPNMVVFSNKTKEQLIEIYKHTNNTFLS